MFNFDPPLVQSGSTSDDKGAIQPVRHTNLLRAFIFKVVDTPLHRGEGCGIRPGSRQVHPAQRISLPIPPLPWNCHAKLTSSPSIEADRKEARLFQRVQISRGERLESVHIIVSIIYQGIERRFRLFAFSFSTVRLLIPYPDLSCSRA